MFFLVTRKQEQTAGPCRSREGLTWVTTCWGCLFSQDCSHCPASPPLTSPEPGPPVRPRGRGGGLTHSISCGTLLVNIGREKQVGEQVVKVMGPEEKKVMLGEAEFMGCGHILETPGSVCEHKHLAAAPGIRSEHRPWPDRSTGSGGGAPRRRTLRQKRESEGLGRQGLCGGLPTSCSPTRPW